MKKSPQSKSCIAGKLLRLFILLAAGILPELLLAQPLNIGTARAPGSDFAARAVDKSKPPVNAFGAPVRDANGHGINYTREELAAMERGVGNEISTVERTESVAPPEFTPAMLGGPAFWQYAIFGSGIGLSNIVIGPLPAGGGPREIILGGNSTTAFTADDFWQVLRRNSTTGNYDQIFVSPIYPSSVKRIAAAKIGRDSQPKIVVMLADGSIYFYDLATKAPAGLITTRIGGLEGLSLTDLDGDGLAELIVTTANDLFVFTGDGDLSWDLAGAGGYEVVAGQMDNDPALEIATTNGSVTDTETRAVQWARPGGFGSHLKLAPLPGATYNQLIAVQSVNATAYDVSTQLARWSILSSMGIAAIEVADVDNDGTPEVIVGDAQWGTIHVHDLVTRAQKWAANNPEHGVTNIAVGDVDNDGVVDLLWGAGWTSTGSDFLYVASTTGTHAIKWQNLDLRGPLLGPVIGDLDGDGQPELVICSYEADAGYDSGRILVFDLATLTQRAISAPVMGNQTTDGVHDLKLRDLDGDGRMEILVAADRGYDGAIEAYGFQSNNTFILRWANTTRPGSAFNLVDVADLDGNGTREIIAGTTRAYGGDPGVFVYIYDYPSDVSTWHFTLTNASNAVTGLVVDDLDGDGGKEIAALASTGDLYTFDGPARQLRNIWQQPGGKLLSRRSPSGLVAGDNANVAHFLQYLGNGYGENFNRQLDSVSLDGLNMLLNGQLWAGAGGKLSLRLPPSYDTEVWQSRVVGAGLGRFIATDFRNGQSRVFSSARHAVAGFTYELPLPTPTPTPTPVPISPPTPTPTPSPTPVSTPVATPTPTPTPNPLNPNNVLVSISTFSGSSVLEFTPEGSLVQTIPFNYDNTGYPASEHIRDIIVDGTGSIASYNGTFAPLLTRYSPTSRSFTHVSYPGWSTVNSIHYGGIAAYQNFIFVTDMSTANGGEPNGIIRFDTSNNTAVRFAQGQSYIKLSMGLDGKLYTSGLTVYDPVTMEVIRQLSLPPGITSQDTIRSITADQTGRLFLCGDQTVYRLSGSGVLEASKSTGFSGLRDMNIDESGRIVIGQGGGRVIMGDTTLANSFTSFQAFTNPWTIFVSFARPLRATLPDPSPIPISTPTPIPTPTPVPTPTPTPIGRPTPTPAYRNA